MLPHDFRIEEVDEHIRDLVIALNKVPPRSVPRPIDGRDTERVRTDPSCQGHIYEGNALWPARDGRVHLTVPQEHKMLLDMLQGYCVAHAPFSLEKSRLRECEYSIIARFEPHRDGKNRALFTTEPELDAYWARARLHAPVLYAGWHDLHAVAEEYISERLGLDPAALPYRESPQPASRHHTLIFK